MISSSPSTTGTLTRRASRSAANRAVPLGLVALGILLVGVAFDRLDGIYAGNAGILRSSQLTPAPLAFGHEFGAALRELRGAEPFLDGEDEAALEQRGRSLFGEGADDSAAASWNEDAGRTVAVVVALFGGRNEAEAAAIRVGSSGAGAELSPGHHTAYVARLEGRRVLVGVLVAAPDDPAAQELLVRTQRHVGAYVGLARLVWFELAALGPLVVLLLLWGSIRILVLLAGCVVMATVGLALAALLLVALIVVVLPLALFRRRHSRSTRDGPAAPLAGEPSPRVSTHDLGPTVQRLRGEGRLALVAVIAAVGLGIALLTSSLFPASAAWGSIVIGACFLDTDAAHWSRLASMIRTALRAIIGFTVAGPFLGYVPFEGVHPFMALGTLPIGLVVVADKWRRLTGGVRTSYGRWYEDIDVRSTLFLIGTALVTVAGGSLFLASNGDPDPVSHIAAKLVGGFGLFVGLHAASYLRASRDAAARERARRRGTPEVLYLRSFHDDRLRLVSPRRHRHGLERFSYRRSELFEDVIAKAFSRVGPVVAIARPGTTQGDLGAARDSIVVDDWLQAVKAYMSRAALIVVVLGRSEGLLVELETLGQLGLVQRICLLVPPVPPAEVIQRIATLADTVSYAREWGPSLHGSEDPLSVVALAGIGPERVVMVHPPSKKRRFAASRSRRTALSYRAVAEDLASLLP